MDFQDLPLTTQGEALRLLRQASKNVNACGDSTVAVGYWVESDTVGCRDEAGDIDRWAAHWEFWDKYANDGVSILIGDPTDGVFVSITPQRDRKATMGAEMLIELGGRRVKNTIPLKKAQKLATEVLMAIESHVQVALIAGSVRRERPEIGDVEFVILPKTGDLEGLLLHLKKIGFSGGDRIQKQVVKGIPAEHQLKFKLGSGIPIELYIAHKVDELGAMLFMYTGDYQHNIAMRSIAKRQGWKLDQYGIWDANGNALLQSPDERDFYDFLGVDYHAPEDRSFKDRPRKKRATMGAEMLIELGSTKRSVRYINLELVSPEEDQTDNWVLKVERTDPFGGDSWKEDFLFEDQDAALTWYNKIVDDEDLDELIRQTSA